MNKRWLLTVGIIGLFVCAQGVRAESAHRVGVGANYWTMLDDVDVAHIDKNGMSWLLTYQYKPGGLLKFELDCEVFPKGFQGIDSVAYAPEAYLVVGSTIYGAVGAGILCADGDFANKPFYALRAGLDLELIPKLYLDLNVNYRFAEANDLSDRARDINGDTLMLGAALRVEL